MNPTLEIQNGRPVLHFVRTFAHPPQKVWRALTEPVHINQWFPFDVKMKLEVGGKVSFMEKGSTEVSMEGVITALDPPRLLAFQWGDDLLRWELEQTGEGCRLTFIHTFDDRAGAASFAAGWRVCLDAMESVLADDPIDPADYVGPAWSRQMAELHERNIRAFALHKGTLEPGEQGWAVRFERQLTRPIDDVWNLLVADDTAPAVGANPPLACTTPQVPAGVITEVAAPNLLVYEWLHAGQVAGQVRWSLGPGTGHGARLTLVQNGPHELAAQQTSALAAWQRHVEELAQRVLDMHSIEKTTTS